MKFKSFCLQAVVAIAAVSLSLAAAVEAGAVDVIISGEVTAPTGAFTALTPIGTEVSGPITVNDAALAAGLIQVADISNVAVRVGGFCFASVPDPNNPPEFPCGDFTPDTNPTLVPVESIDQAAITGTNGVLGGSFSITAFSPTFMVSIPIAFDLDAGTFFAQGGALGTVAGDSILTAPALPLPEIDTTPAAGSTLAFGEVIAGTGAVVQTVTINNTGDAALTITSATASGGLTDLVVTDDCMGTIAAAGTCAVTATLTPTVAGAVASVLTIVSDDADEAVITFPITGNIVLPAGLTSDTTMAMPLLIDSVAIGGTETGIITVTNTGGVGALLGTATMPTGPFSITTDNCSTQLLPGGADCTFVVEFAPTESGQFASNFTLQIAEPLLANGGGAISTNMFVMSSTLDPNIDPATTSLVIPNTMVNSTNSETLLITNSGAADLEISSIAGLVDPFSVASETCTSGAIAPTMTCSIVIEFAPTALDGLTIGTLSITSNDPDNSPLAITVSAVSTEELVPDIAATATQLIFPTPLLIGESESQVVTISNMGTADLTIDVLLFTPLVDSSFSLANTTTCMEGATLAPAEQCTIVAIFEPISGGALNAEITLTTNDPDTPQLTIGLSGTGVVPEPNIVLSATSLDLGVVSIGDNSTGTVTVTNMGTANLNISSVTIPAGDYSQTNDCGAALLAPTDTCTVNVTFTPTADATIAETLTIVSNDPDSMMSAVSLTGRGVLAPEPNIAGSASSLDLGNGLFGTVLNGSVVISNNGNATLTITGVTLGGADASEFTAGGDCVGMLAEAATCTATVQFMPAAPEGAKSAVLSIASDDADTPSFDIALTGSSEMPVPEAMFSATSLDFGDVTLGDSGSQIITVSNMGTGELTVSSVVLTGGAGSAFAIGTENCIAAAVAVNSSCDVSVTFTPTTVDDLTDTLTINSDDPAMPAASISLTGAGVAVPVPDIAVDVASLAYGSVLFSDVGELTLTVTNNGTADLNIASSTIAPAGEFSATTACGVVVPSASCTIDVTYRPTVQGDVSATLTIASDDPDTPQLDVSLTGSGVAPEPEIEFSENALDFGSIVADMTNSIDLIISNTGMADLVISSLTLSGTNQSLFSQVNDCATVVMNDSCTVTVTYAPTDAGAAVATLTVVSSDADEASVDIGLTGLATPVPMPMIDVPATLDIGDVNGGETGTGTIAVSNNGTADLTISDVSISGANAADFSQANACATVAAGASCDITIEFTPASAGAASANVVITSNDVTSPSTVAVTANGLFPIPTLSVSTLDLGGIRIGQSGNAPVTISNTGNADLVVSSVVLTGVDAADFTLNNGCANVVAGASCVITATFTPQSEGDKMASITITTNDPTQPAVVIPLSATGAPMEEVVVTVESKGGNGSFAWLELAGLLLLAGLARRLRFKTVMLGLALVASPLALADNHSGASKDGYWYAGAGFGSSDGQADVGSIERGIEDAGVTAMSFNIDDTDSGFKVFGGYQATEHFAVEVGFVDLGEADVDLQLGDVALDELPLISRAVSGNLSLLGSGVFGSVVVKQSIGETFGVFARLGLVSWEVDTAIAGSTNMGTLNVRETESGTDFTFGLGAEAWFGSERKFGLRGEWERYELGQQDAEFLSLGVLYRF
ncbi:MAG: beta strand repeat-containing protein [Gammaproteobacteria bacterium]